jgi:hypothetical protein
MRVLRALVIPIAPGMGSSNSARQLPSSTHPHLIHVDGVYEMCKKEDPAATDAALEGLGISVDQLNALRRKPSPKAGDDD